MELPTEVMAVVHVDIVIDVLVQDVRLQWARGGQQVSTGRRGAGHGHQRRPGSGTPGGNVGLTGRDRLKAEGAPQARPPARAPGAA